MTETIWSTDAIRASALAIHTRTCCPMDAINPCDQADLPIADAEAALVAVEPDVVELIEQNQRLADLLVASTARVEKSQNQIKAHVLREYADQGLTEFVLDHLELDGTEEQVRLIEALRLHLRARADELGQS